MSLGILGNKIGMIRLFDESGSSFPATVIKVGPCIVTDIKTITTHSYNSIQVGYGDISLRFLNKPQQWYFRKIGINPLKYLKEYRVDNPENFAIGQIICADIFKNSKNLIDITGTTCGKGFSGLQKKYNFARGPMTHGSKSHRAPGSIGMGTTPGRVFPGKRMSGQLGNTKTTIKALKIISIDVFNNTLVVKGSVPGKLGNLLDLKISNK
jgi:large subunit ribosomal protein L3